MELTYNDLLTVSIKATANTVRRRFIGFDGAVCAANAKALGVSSQDTDINQQIPVMAYGIAIVEAGGAINPGDPVVSDATGLALAATAVSVAVPSGATPVTSTGAQPTLTVAGGKLPQAVNGFALDTATTTGDLIRVKLV